MGKLGLLERQANNRELVDYKTRSADFNPQTRNGQSMPKVSTEAQRQILSLVEYYFSDDYLEKDTFFLRQILKKRDGFLSIKFITKFKKIRKLVEDSRITCYCLRGSDFLLVNDEGSKVKRKLEVPMYLKLMIFPPESRMTNISRQLCRGQKESQEVQTLDPVAYVRSQSQSMDENLYEKNLEQTKKSQNGEFKSSCLSQFAENEILEDDKLISDVFKYVLKHTACV